MAPSRLRTLPVLALVLAAATGCGASEATGARPSAPSPFRVTYVAAGLQVPTGVVARPGDPGRFYVPEQAGTIRIVDEATGAMEPRPFLDISDRVLPGGERGLLGLAFHPDHQRNGLAYVHYTRKPDGDTRVLELKVRGDRASIGDARTILRIDQPYENHKGGQLSFGPDGRLYLGMGDGGSAFDPRQNAQRLDTRLGKVLAMDVDRPERGWKTVAYGLRNPWRLSFDRATGDLYVADVGQDRVEEVNFMRAGEVTAEGPRGLVNFGWAAYEGRLRQRRRRLDQTGALRFPISAYDHTDGGCSVTGGYVYRGRKIPALRGRYLFGDFCRGTIWSFKPVNGRPTDLRREEPRLPNLTSFGEGLDGELYAATIDGQVHRIVPSRPVVGEPASPGG